MKYWFKTALCKCRGSGREFNYHQLEVGPACTTLGWTYDQDCVPVTSTMQGFLPQDITSHQLSSPQVSLYSASSTFALGSGNGGLYFRTFGRDRNGRTCTASPMTQFYNCSLLLENGNLKGGS